MAANAAANNTRRRKVMFDERRYDRPGIRPPPLAAAAAATTTTTDEDLIGLILYIETLRTAEDRRWNSNASPGYCNHEMKVLLVKKNKSQSSKLSSQGYCNHEMERVLGEKRGLSLLGRARIGRRAPRRLAHFVCCRCKLAHCCAPSKTNSTRVASARLGTAAPSLTPYCVSGWSRVCPTTEAVRGWPSTLINRSAEP